MGRTYRCANCKTKKPTEGEIITAGINRFCSLSCRKKFNSDQNKKQLAKIKEKKTKIKVKKQNSVSVLKKKLWKIISEYIRRRDSNEEGFGKCCTCGLEKHWKELQAGHYIPSGSSSFHRYNEFNIHIQCYGCNCGKGGNLIEYRPFMIEKYGLEFTEELYETRNELTDLGTFAIKKLIEEFTIKLNNLGVNGI